VGLAIALLPASAAGQTSSDVVWHWYGGCAGSDSLALEIKFDGKDLYATTFPVCKVRRSQIKPEPEQRLIKVRFTALPKRFRASNKEPAPVPITCSIWESRGDGNSIRFGVQFATKDESLLNTNHPARVDIPTRTERVRGFVIDTRPVRRSDKKPAAPK
jgi:hypothetical protein